MKRALCRIAGAAAILALAHAAHAADNRATELEGPAVEVIVTTPVPGLGTPLREVPASVQGVDAEELKRQDALDASEYFERNFTGVNLNAAQSNSLQNDVQFRGFSASPLLGLPQGLSVFVDGVRVNEAFGDTVNWDLIPRNAISTVHLLSGSVPVFGLNTLGGALSVHTKSGFAYPGQSGRLGAGAFGRRSLELESGGHGRRADYFVAANAFDEAGWREHSPSSVRQLFAKAGWQDSRSDVDFSVAVADNALQGVQALPDSMLGNRRQAYTWPDRTDNSLAFATLRASHFVQDNLLLAGNLYLRELRQKNFNSNVNDDHDPALTAGPGNAQGFNDRHALAQRMMGASLQLTAEREFGPGRNQLTLGASLDQGDSRFAQQRQEALFSADRATLGMGDFAERVRLRGTNRYLGLYFSEQYTPSERWTLSVSGRYNLAHITLRDESGIRPAIDGEHSFRRFNPGLGATWNPSESTTWYASWNQGMRAPSPVELTCADPAAPCSLPNEFLADPPLKPVVARTLQLGVRARGPDRARFTASIFRSVLNDDIQFVSSSGALNAGFFRNVGRTLREGLELGVRATMGDVTLRGGYSMTRAVYLTSFRMHSPNNSSSDSGGDIDVSGGSRLPGIPSHSFKLRADWTPSERWSLGLGWTWFGRQYARGDENNRDANGPLPGYIVANLVGRYALGGGWELSFKADNVLNRKYENFAVLGTNFFAGPGQSFDAASARPEQFRSPGAPRAIWIALRYETDDKPRR